jgi:proteasome-associated ATPase
MVIGASNREDLIDPAILRPGRLDVKIKISRPGIDAAREIFRIYLEGDIPLDADELAACDGDRAVMVAETIESTVAAMFSEGEENRFLEVTYANGDREILYFKDFASGAMIENIVRRAKKDAIKREIAGGPQGIRRSDLLAAIKQEFREHEEKGERIVYVRTLIGGEAEARLIEAVSGGQYL